MRFIISSTMVWIALDATKIRRVKDALKPVFQFNSIQWRKFTFSGGGGAKPLKFPTTFSNVRHTPPPFALEKTVFSPLLSQNFRKFGNFPWRWGGGAAAPAPKISATDSIVPKRSVFLCFLNTKSGINDFDTSTQKKMLRYGWSGKPA
jgi:hypothetical protein